MTFGSGKNFVIVDYSIHNVTVALIRIFKQYNMALTRPFYAQRGWLFQALNWKLKAFQWTRLSSERDVLALQICIQYNNQNNS